MVTNTGNLSLYLGVSFIIFAISILIFYYYLIKNNIFEADKLDKLSELAKWVISSVLIVVASSVIADGFKERDQDIKELEVFDKYTTLVTTIEGIEQKWLLCEYFVAVSPSGDLQKSWMKYKDVLQPSYEEYLRNKKQIIALENKDSITNKDKEKIVTLIQRNQVLDQSLVSNVPKSEVDKSEWAIIAGGDVTVEAADFEVSKVKKLNYAVSIFKKGNMYRTVVGPFAYKQEALEAIVDIKRNVNKDAYVVNFSNWCNTSEAKSGFVECY